MKAATVHQAMLALWAAVALISLGGCVFAPAVVRASQQPYHNRMDALEERYVQLRAERKNLVTALEGASAEEGAPQLIFGVQLVAVIKPLDEIEQIRRDPILTASLAQHAHMLGPT